MLRIHFLRHGQTPMSRADVFCGGQLDPPLTDDGLAMAEAFAHTYRHAEWRAIYSSPLNRAMSTAAPLARLLAMSVESREELAELHYGQWDGKTAEEI